MRTRRVVVPLDKKSESLMNFDDPNVRNFREFILDEELFLDLYKNSVFDLINTACNSLIDDFEEEIISDKQKIVVAIAQLNKLYDKTESKHSWSKGIKELTELFRLALNNDTSVHFFL